MRYKIEGHDDVVKLTSLPVIADVAVASESAKSAAGIVVHENKNDQIDEIFRSMRTNIQFMPGDSQKAGNVCRRRHRVRERRSTPQT